MSGAGSAWHWVADGHGHEHWHEHGGAHTAGLATDELGLLPVAVGVWRGLVFVNLAPDPAPLADAFGPFAAECDMFAMEDLHFSHQVAHDVAANWKTYADNESCRKEHIGALSAR